MNCQRPSLPQHSAADARPPLVPEGMRRRPGRDRARPTRRRAHGAGGGRSARAKQPHFAPKAKNVIFLFMAGAPSHLELFDNKPQLAKFDGKLPPPELLKGYRAAFINPNSKLLGPEVQVRQARPERGGAFGAAAAPGGRRRRHRHRQVDGHRRLQPRPGPDPDEHRLAAVRPAEPRRVDAVRPGQRVAEPARLRRLQHRQEGPQRRQRRTGAAASCRRSIRACRSAPAATRCCILSNPPGVDDAAAARFARRDQRAQSAAARRRSAIPKSPRGSTRSRWPSACRPAPRS